MKRIRNILFISALLISAAGELSAKDVKFEISVDRQEAAMGERAQLGMTFYGTQSMPAPDLGNPEGLEVRYLGPSTMMTVINGRVSSSITHMYSVTPLKTGRFQLGPYAFNYSGDRYSSNMIFLDVVEGKKKARPIAPPPPQRFEGPIEKDISDRLSREERIFVTLSADKTKAYVNELIPITVKLYVNRLNMSDIQLPAFDQEGFSKVEFKEPKQYRERRGASLYDVLEFRTNIYGTRPGDYRFGPAKIKGNVIVKKRVQSRPSTIDDFFSDEFDRDSFFDDFFTRFEKHPVELKSEDVPITILPLPEEGKPADFMGAVGDYQFIYNAGPTRIKVGDPVTVTMMINGLGNFNTVLIPKLEEMEGFRVYEPSVKTEPNRKTFTQVLIPETDTLTSVPRATFSYLDTTTGRYKTIAQGPIPIEVEKGKEEAPAQVVGPSPAAASAAAPQEELARDIVYIKESPAPFVRKNERIYRNRIFLGGWPVLFGLFVVTLIMRRKSEKLREDTRQARRIKASRTAKKALKALRPLAKAGDAKVFYEAMFKALQDYLGDRLHIAKGGITADIVSYVSFSGAVEPDIAIKIKNLFSTCDQARFALLVPDGLKMAADLSDFELVIKYFERLRS